MTPEQLQQLAEEKIPAISDDFTYPGSAVTKISRNSYIAGFTDRDEMDQWVKIEKYKNVPPDQSMVALLSPTSKIYFGRLNWGNGWNTSVWETSEGSWSMNQFSHYYLIPAFIPHTSKN